MVAQLKKSKTTLLVLGALVASLTIGGMSIANAAGRAPQTVTRAYASAPTMGTTPGAWTVPTQPPAPSVPATVGVRIGYRGPNPHWSASAPAPFGPRYSSTTTRRGRCRTYVAPTAPAPAGGTSGGTTNSGGAWTGMMGPRTSGGTRGSGSCGW